MRREIALANRGTYRSSFSAGSMMNTPLGGAPPFSFLSSGSFNHVAARALELSAAECMPARQAEWGAMTRPLLALLLAGLALAGAAAEPGAHAVAVHAPLTTHADAAVPALLPARRSAVSTTARAATDGAHSPAGRRLAGGGESGGGAAAESRGEARLGPFEGWPSLALLIALCACACCVLPLVVLFYTHRLRALQRGLGAQPSSAVPLVMITDTGQGARAAARAAPRRAAARARRFPPPPPAAPRAPRRATVPPLARAPRASDVRARARAPRRAAQTWMTRWR